LNALQFLFRIQGKNRKESREEEKKREQEKLSSNKKRTRSYIR